PRPSVRPQSLVAIKLTNFKLAYNAIANIITRSKVLAATGIGGLGTSIASTLYSTSLSLVLLLPAEEKENKFLFLTTRKLQSCFGVELKTEEEEDDEKSKIMRFLINSIINGLEFIIIPKKKSKKIQKKNQ